MKRWLGWMLAVVCLLSGCSGQPDETANTEAIRQTQPKETTPVHSIYWSGSLIEDVTGGAVRVYGPDEGGITGMGFLGGDPVVLTAAGEADTVVTRFDGETGQVKGSARIAGELYTQMGTVAMKDNRFAYYDSQSNCCRILDGNLKLLDTYKLPETVTGVLLSADLTTAYYCTEGEIRALNLQTGIPRLVCQMNVQEIYLDSLLFDGTVLGCFVTDAHGDSYTVFLDTADGVTLGSDANLLTIGSVGDTYLLRRVDGTTEEVLLGRQDGQLQRFTPTASGNHITLLTMGVLERSYESGGAVLSLYETEEGKKIGALPLDGVQSVSSVTEDPNGRYLWIISQDPDSKQDVLYRWDYTATGNVDDTTRLNVRYTAQNPDVAGIAHCRELAQQLEEKYGVDIHIADEVVAAENYTFTQEYQVDAFKKALSDLDRAMAKFPEGFFKTAAKVSNDRKLHICLIRNYRENVLNAPTMTDGMRYLVNGNFYIALCAGNEVEPNFYHNLSHAVDTYVYSFSVHYDISAWSNCNPEGFAYDESYDFYHNHEGSPYLQGENRAFINAYSMTYAHEDRAMVMQYAMMDGMESYFESEIMQAKLRQLCLGLRQAFGWRKYEGTFAWEQYLKESVQGV